MGSRISYDVVDVDVQVEIVATRRVVVSDENHKPMPLELPNRPQASTERPKRPKLGPVFGRKRPGAGRPGNDEA